MIRRYPRALLLVAWLVSPFAFAGDAPIPACVAHSTASLDALVRGDFAGARKDFSTATAQALDVTKLSNVWSQLQDQVGAYQQHGSPRTKLAQSHSLVVTSVTFAKMPLDFVIACDAHDKITTLRLVPSTATQSAQHNKTVMPVKAHVEANGTRVRPLAVTTPFGPLQGALTLPAGNGPFPAVVLLAGSGPNGRDETIGPNKPLKDIADGLAAAGIASLRYDKRTLTYGTQMATRGNMSVDDEVTDDALTAVHLLGQQKEVNPRRLFVLGHSLGAMMAPRVGKRDPKLAGLILLAAPARPTLDLLIEQLRYLGGQQGLSAQQIEQRVAPAIAERKLLDNADPKSPPRGSFFGASQDYWMSLHSYHPVEVAQSLSMPMLVLQGGSDYQVSPTRDFSRWKAAFADDPRVQFHEYAGLSHLFMLARNPPSPADYGVPGHVDPQVIRDIAKWIKARN